MLATVYMTDSVHFHCTYICDDWAKKLSYYESKMWNTMDVIVSFGGENLPFFFVCIGVGVYCLTLVSNEMWRKKTCALHHGHICSCVMFCYKVWNCFHFSIGFNVNVFLFMYPYKISMYETHRFLNICSYSPSLVRIQGIIWKQYVTPFYSIKTNSKDEKNAWTCIWKILIVSNLESNQNLMPILVILKHKIKKSSV